MQSSRSWTREWQGTIGELASACLSATLWGWASGSAVVAALTLVNAAVAILVARKGSRSGPRRGLFERALRAFWIGALWTAVDVLWARFGIGTWGRF